MCVVIADFFAASGAAPGDLTKSMAASKQGAGMVE